LNWLEAALRERTQDAPGFGAFLSSVGVSLVTVALVTFVLRHTPPVRFLRAQLDRLLGGLVATLLLAMVVLSILQIVLRNVFESGLLWIDPLLRHLVLLLAFTGALIATSMKRHVQINVIGRLFRGTAERWVGLVVACVAALVCLALAHASVQLLASELEFPETVFLDVPSWAVVLVFPLSFLLLSFRFTFLALQEIAGESPRSVEGEAEGLVAPDREPDA